MPNKDKTITTRDVVEKIDKANQNGTTVLDEAVVTGENKSGVKPITAQAVTEDKSGIIPRMQRLGHINKPLEPMNLDTSKAVDKDAKGALASAVAGNSPVMHTINKTYGNTLEELGKNVGSLVEQGQKARENDEVAQRRERNMQMISGISDGLASLANLIGVGGYGASNIDLSGAMTNPKLQEKFELARKERKADIKDIDDRLEQKRRELLEMQQRFGLAKAEQLQKEKTEAETARRFNEEMNFKKERAKVSDSQWQHTFDANQENAAADRSLRQTQITNDYNIRMKQLNQSAEQAGLKGSVPILIGDNEMLDIPKNEINNATIGRIFEQLPKEFKDLAQGKPLYRYEPDESGMTTIKVFDGYEQPTLDQKLAAIGAASRTDKTIQDELRKLAGTYKPGEKVEQGTQSTSGNWDDYADAEDADGVTEYSSLPQEAQDYLKKMQERQARKQARNNDPNNKEIKRAWINTMSNQK